MKKLFALLLAVLMIASLATVAFADEATNTAEWKSDVATVKLVLNKIYTVTGQKSGNSVIVPDETLSFTSTAATTNPDVNANLTIGTLDDGAMKDNEGKTAKTGTMSITLPEYTKVGVYNYTIEETAGTAQGATYSGAKIGVQVLVTYDYDNSKLATQIVLTTTGTTSDADGKEDEVGEGTVYKLDTFENKYELGELDVKKTVSGNLADKDVEFKMTVKFTSEKEVKSDITITDGSNNTTDVSDTSVAASAWTKNETGGKWEATATIYVKDSETVKITNIPAGVSYTVEEDSQHLLADGATLNPNSATDVEYTVAYTGESGTVPSNNTATATVTNTKNTTVETGVALDSMPYILLLAVAVIGLGVVVSKKRYEV